MKRATPSRVKNHLAAFLLHAVVLASLCSCASTSQPGLRNFHCVSPGIYRSAQPSTEDFAKLEEQGFKTILDLRERHSDASIAAPTSKLSFKQVPMNAGHIQDASIAAALAQLRDRRTHPILVHCRFGSDRTGTVIAMHRIVDEGWDKERAIKEMRTPGYGFHRWFWNIPRYIRRGEDTGTIGQSDNQTIRQSDNEAMRR